MLYSFLGRTLVLVFGLTLVGARPAFSQRLSLGFEGGFRSSSVSLIPEDEDVAINPKPDFRMGVSLHLDLGGPVDVRAGVLYARKGFDADVQLFGSAFELSINFGYLELPVLAVFTVPVGGSSGVTPFIAVGPVVAIELGCDVIARAQDESVEATCANDADDLELPTSAVEFGVQFGGGVTVPAGPVSLMFEIAYNLGFTNVTDDPDFGFKHRGLLLTFGLMVPIG